MCHRCFECQKFAPQDLLNQPILNTQHTNRKVYDQYLSRIATNDNSVVLGIRTCTWPGKCFGSEVCQRPQDFISRE